tara:strand:+ start:126 stop:1595 length:1470 start_codon:yes stop_codon:yes gene_type:complete
MISIKKTFAERNKWINYRASAIFPCYINDKNDQVISFQNYWFWKRRLTKLKFFITLIDEKTKISKKKKLKIKDHNEFSIKNIFNLKNFKGIIHCEVKSTKNLRFAFPGIVCFFINTTGLLSCVHSSGRILNNNEKDKNHKHEESNFYCRLNSKFEPFFHLFRGNKIVKNNSKINISGFNYKNEKIFEFNHLINLKKPYSSKIFFISKITPRNIINKIKNKEFFLVIRYEEKNIFGRLVAGNYDKENDAIFATHTLNVYDKKNNKDFVLPSEDKNSTTFLPLMSDKNLNLRTVIYPINQKFNINFFNKIVNQQNKKLKPSKEINKISSGPTGEVFLKKIKDRKFNLLYSNKKVPGRIYVSHNYSFKNSRHPTDIGTAFHNSHMPPKKNHWGQSVSKKNYKTMLLIRNVSHNIGKTNDAKCNLECFNNSLKLEKNFSIAGDSFKILNLEKILKKIKSNFFSWRLSSNSGNLEVIWLSYNNRNRSVCGDHSF